MSWRGVRTLKLPSDLFNVQELIHEMRPALVLETGTLDGGSAIFYGDALDLVREPPPAEGQPASAAAACAKVLTVDITLCDAVQCVSEIARQHPRVEVMTASSTNPVVAARAAALRR